MTDIRRDCPQGRDHSQRALVALMPDLMRLSRALTRDRAKADDLAQEALARVWARIVNEAEIGDLRPYLMTAARNLARRPEPELAELTEMDDPSVPPRIHARMALRHIAQALSAMPPEDSRLLLRHAAKGESYAEIARSEAMPLGTVMSRLSRLRRRLRADCGLPERGAVCRALADGG